VSPALASLIALQQLDTAADAARRRIADMPAAEQEVEARVTAAVAVVDGVKARIAENQQVRRALEKDGSQLDARLSRFDDHRAAVKTNQEYTALLHEIQTAKGEKDALEERILVLLEEADALSAELKQAEAAVAAARQEAAETHRRLAGERQELERELTRLEGQRRGEIAGIAPPLVAKYEQLLKQRRFIAVAAMVKEICSACHVRLRPQMAQHVRRNEDIVQCDNCQRILYFQPPVDG
jgi:predicted  nucleic acid-binding Zn-ribbon protein